MTDIHQTNHNKSETSPDSLDDSLPLNDIGSRSKWFWLVVALVAVVLVLCLQAGVRTFFASVAEHAKNKMKPTASSGHKTKSLPFPTREGSVSAQPLTNSLARVSKTESPELMRLRLERQLRIAQKNYQQQEDMRQSPVLVNIGVQETHAERSTAFRQQALNGYQNPNTLYLKSLSHQGVEEVKAMKLGDLRFLVLKGKVIRGVTESAIDSDLPTIIRGHVTETVYGAQGAIALINNGDELIGEYRSGDIRPGQTRLFVVWTRLRLQNGITVELDSGGADPLGRAGMGGAVNHHYLERFGTAALSSILSAGTATVGVNGWDRYNSEAAYRSQVSTAMSQLAAHELQGHQAIQNSIQPPQGTEISILVNKDISFADVLRRE